MPFSFARQIWGISTLNIEETTKMLKKVAKASIVKINKGKIVSAK